MGTRMQPRLNINANLDIGDRVELIQGNVFGTVRDIELLGKGFRVLVRLANGTESWMWHSRCGYSPTPRDIRRACLKMQAGWSDVAVASRLGVTLREQKKAGWTAPVFSGRISYDLEREFD